MIHRTDRNSAEKIPCDIIAGTGKTSHAPISAPLPEETNVRL